MVTQEVCINACPAVIMSAPAMYTTPVHDLSTASFAVLGYYYVCTVEPLIKGPLR